MARPSKYESHVEPRLAEIAQWSANGSTHKEIAAALGISIDTFCTYLKNKPAFSEALKKGRVQAIADIKAALAKRAKGYEYVEVKEIDDPKNGLRIERTYKHQPPDPASANMLLKNWERGEWLDNPAAIDLKREELELKKRIAEQGSWASFDALG